MAAPLDFYFEFASPYGYLASLRIDAIAAAHEREVAWRPVMLGAAFKRTGAGPNMTLPLKGDDRAATSSSAPARCAWSCPRWRR
ncbi:MAG: DsbA family protein [Geminicoccaceae bacterium]